MLFCAIFPALGRVLVLQIKASWDKLMEKGLGKAEGYGSTRRYAITK